MTTPHSHTSLAALSAEFDRQVANLADKGYPDLAGLAPAAFAAACEPLRDRLQDALGLPFDEEAGQLPFVLVVPSRTVPAEDAMVRVVRKGKAGIVSLSPVIPADFLPLSSVTVPEGPFYLILGFERGDAYRNVRPEDALKSLVAAGRSPLTLEEGVAVVTQHPDCLIKNHCFSLPGSRRGDQRVPAVWLSENRPKLGWCWDRNPHTWLGSASCLARVGMGSVSRGKRQMTNDK